MLRVEAQVEVRVVVVLCNSLLALLFLVYSWRWEGGAYSFAKTPLKAAHAPLAAASGIQGSLLLRPVVLECGLPDRLSLGLKGSVAD